MNLRPPMMNSPGAPWRNPGESAGGLGEAGGGRAPRSRLRPPTPALAPSCTGSSRSLQEDAGGRGQGRLALPPEARPALQLLRLCGLRGSHLGLGKSTPDL